MSAEPLAARAADPAWSDCIVNQVVVIVTIVLFLIELSNLLRIYPMLFRCLSRWKGNIELEHSVSMARTRNTVALVTALMLVLVADRWKLVNPSFKQALALEWQLAVSAGLIAGYVLLRRLAYQLMKYRSSTSEFASTLRHVLFNYQILLTSLMVLSALLLAGFRLPENVLRSVLYVECIVFAVLYLLRTGQIFASRCNIFTTILYLCALEILPLGILIFVCTL